MKSVQPINKRYTPQALCLGPDIEFNIISEPIPPLVLEEDIDTFIRPFVSQAGDEKQFDTQTVEVTGETNIGATTKSAEDGEIIHVEPKAQYSLSKLLRRPNQDGVLHDIKNFLARPYIIQQGVLTSTDTSSTFPFISCFQALSSANMYVSKLRGAYIVRATTHFTLQINGNRMQQGRYLLCYMPTGGMKPTLSNPAFKTFYRMHRYSRVECTQLMHANIDVNCDTQAELEIPYTSNSPGWVFSDNFPLNSLGDPGVVFITPYYSVVSISGSADVSYTLMVHYTNIEIDGVGVAQAGKVRKRGDVLEAETFANRPISQTLNVVSNIAKFLTNIPMLSGIASMSHVVADALSGAAYTLGWSRPLQIQPFHRTRREEHPYLTVCDAHDYSDSLALTVNNSVGVMGGLGGNDLDELSIDFLKVKSAFFSEFAWTTAQAAGTVLASFAVSPVVAGTTSDTKNNIHSWTPIHYLARLYSYWRGSLIYTFKFAKTEFHSGRLNVRYVPFDGIAYTDPGITSTNRHYTLKTIVDVREMNEISIQVPYLYARNWTDTYPTGYNYTGSLIIEVLDPLVAPGTVSGTITCGVEIGGGDDLQFSVPYAPLFNDTGNLLKSLVPTEPFIFQSGTPTGRSDCSLGDDVIGGATIPAANFVNMAACHGEVTTSLRQLVKRGSVWHGRSLGGTTNRAQAHPRGISTLLSATGALDGHACWDPLNYVSMLYHSMRGGVRIKMLPVYGGTPGEHTVISNLSMRPFGMAVTRDFVTAAGALAANVMDQSTGQCTLTRMSQGGCAIQVPQYSRTYAMNVGDQLQQLAFLSPDLNTVDQAAVQMTIVGSTGTGTNVPNTYTHRSAADDFNLAGFVSVPCTSTYVSPA